MSADGGCPTCGGFDGLDGRTPVCRCGSAWADRPRKRLTRRTPLGHGGKGLSRGTGLAASRGLSPGTGLTRAAPLPAGRAPIARAASSPQPRRPRVAADVRALVLARSRERCEAGVLEACRARGRRLDSPEGTNQHHRNPGRMGGTKRAGAHAASNLLQVCGAGNTSGCHGWIESNRDAARELGLLLRDGQDPAVTPVRLWNGRRVLLDDTGGYVDAPRVPAPTS